MSAWDDDFPSLGDASKRAPPPAPKPSHAPPPRLSRAERKAQQEEINKAIWDRAENPETFHFLESRNDPPLRSEFQPQLKVLSRKPQIAKQSLDGRMQNLSLAQQKEDEDSEEEARSAEARKLKERQEQAKREREEKQRRYEQRRQELFGTGNESSEKNGNLASSRVSGRPPRGAGRGRGGRRGGSRGGSGAGTPSSNDRSPALSPSPTPRAIYDPNSDPRQEGAQWQRRIPQESDGAPIRQPRGAGHGPGFATRGRSGLTS